ncbi:Ig-like domain-containing protein [Staphylococcus sp. IVB6238]|uniref:Ig-like domain-containing protein n=1 Tax=Staphylococcus sp. IVB6238 TaxID=2989770 RepID=UPI0021D1D7B2|nr:Ig-like domain-containing protein [Staphylococcus sp. IVB6238]UXR73765.1 Ig-like domain-containing protein [Staphylococcus sp. IVB6238]
MANKKTKSSTRFDFLPNKQNKYSIRKFTVGTASILVGATLVFGAYNDAQAAELDEKTAESAAATDDEVAKEEATATEEVAAEETAATEETAADSTSEEAVAEEAPATEEAATTAEEAEPTATEEAAVAEKPANVIKAADTAEETVTPEATPVSEEATSAPETTTPAPAVEATPATTPETTTPAPAVEATPATTPETTSNTSTEVPATDIQTVKDQTSAADYLAAEKNISTEEANKIASNLNANLSEVTPEALQQAIVDYLANEQNKYNVDGTLAAVREETALTNEDVVTEQPVAGTMLRSAATTATRAADAEEAIYVPGANDQVYTYKGKAWIYDADSMTSAADKVMPATKVYLQWVDGKGVVSPVFYTTTNPDGTFAFNFLNPDWDGKDVADKGYQVKDEDGNVVTKWQIAGDGGFAVKTWVDNPDPAKYNVIKSGDKVTGFHSRLNRTNESWNFTTGVNVVENSQVILQEKPNSSDMLLGSEENWTTSPSPDGIWPNTGNYGIVSGKAWYEAGDIAGSPNHVYYGTGRDVWAAGTKVAASYVNDEVTRRFDAWKNDPANAKYTKEQFKEAQAKIISEYEAEFGKGSHIAETVVATVDNNGDFYIPFKGLYGYSAYKQNLGLPISHKVSDEEYGTLVKDEEVNHNQLLWGSNIGQKHRHINTDYVYMTTLVEDYPVWSNAYQGNMFESITDDDAQSATAGLSNYAVFFALIADTPEHDILTYDSVNNTATVGDTAESKTSGLIPNQEYQVQWFKDGEAIGEPTTVTSDQNGVAQSVPLTVPEDITGKTVYTSAVFWQGESTKSLTTALAIDSFTAYPPQNEDTEPAYTDEQAKPGVESTSTPTFTNNDGEKVDLADVPLSDTEPFKITGEAIPGVTIDPLTGEIKFKPTPEQANSTVEVPVTVTYEDGTTDTVTAKFTVGPSQADENDPTATEEVVEKGGEVDLSDNVDTTDLPEGTKVTDVTPAGTIDTNVPGEYTGTVEVTYPDGSKDTVEVPVTVKPSQADENDPTATEEVVEKGGEVDLSDNVDTTDLPEGTKVTDVTPAGTIDTNVPGEYTGTVEVTYPDGSKDTVEVPVKVKPSQADENEPTATEEVVEKGGKVDLSDNVDTTDLPEGTTVTDVTPTGTIDTNTPGEYTGTVEVTYPDGSKDTVEVPVKVVDKLTDADQNDPKVTEEVVEKGGKVDLSDNVDTTDLPEGTTVTDVTPAGTIDTNTPGEYTGTVEVTYPDGSKDTVEVPVKVVDKLTDADQNDPTVTEEVVEKGGEVDLTDNVDTTDLPEGTTVTDVTPAGTIDTNAPGEYTGTVEVTYPDGSKDTVEVPVKVQDTTAPDAPKVNTPQPGGKEITGKSEPNGTVDVTLPNGDVIKDVPVDADGNYKVDVPEGVELKEDDKVTVVAKDDSGNTSTPTEVTVTDTVAPDAPKVDTPQPGGKEITGKSEPNGTVDVTLPNGDVIKDVPVDADGNYKVDVPEGVELKEGDKVTVVAKDGNGNTSTPTEVTVTDTVAPDAPKVNTPQPGGKEITGKSEPNGTVDVTLPNGDVIKDVPVDADGNYKVDVPEGVELKEGDKVTVVAKDGNGNTSTPTEATVTDTVAPDAPTVTNPQPGDKTITGTAEPNGTVDVTLPNGDVIKDVPVDADGNYKVDVPEGVELKEDDKVTVVAKDDSGNTSTPTEVTVTDTVAPDAPKVDTPQPGGKEITGKSEPNGTVDVTLPNGDVIKDVPVDADGNYKVDVPEGVELKEGDKVTVVAKDGNGNTSTPTEATVTDTVAPDAPKVNTPQPGGKEITGKSEPNGTVDVTLPNGDVIKDVPVDADGNYKVDVPEGVELKEGDKVTVVAKDGNGNTSTPTEATVTDTVAPDAPTVTNPQPGDKTITGTAEPNGTVDVTLPNGDVIKDVPVDENGNWSVDVPKDVELKEGDKVTVVAKDGNGNTSTPTEATVTDTVAPDAPTVDPVKAGDKEVTGKGEPGTTITVKFPDGKEGTATVDENGNWTVKVPDGTEIKPGDELEVSATDKAGNKSEVTKVKVPADKDTVAPEKPEVNPVQPGDTEVTGKGEPGSEITVKFPDGKEGTTTVDKDGNWTVKVPEGTTIKPGDKLIVTATDEAGNTSEPTVVVVPDEKSDDNTGKSGNTGNTDNTGMTGKTGNTSNTDNSNAGDMGNMDATPAVKGDMSEAKDMNNNGKEVNELPETGNESTNAPLFGSLIAALGSLFLLGRRRKENEEK